MTSADISPSRTRLRRRSRLLVWATIVWNAVEAVVAISAGTSANSRVLLGFGLDSSVEVSASLIAIWYLRGDDDERGWLAGRLIGLSFWALAAWVGLDAGTALIMGDEPDVSGVGVVLAALSVTIMPTLAIVKRRTAQALGSKALVAEANETLICAYLSIAVLIGLAANALFAWWWADPLAALVVAALAAREGLEAWRGEPLGEDGCC